MKGDSLVRLERKDQRPTLHRKVWNSDGRGRPKILGCFLSGNRIQGTAFLAETDKPQEHLLSRSRYSKHR